MQSRDGQERGYLPLGKFQALFIVDITGLQALCQIFSSFLHGKDHQYDTEIAPFPFQTVRETCRRHVMSCGLPHRAREARNGDVCLV